MTLTVAEIHRWNSESVREVFHLARGRSQAMHAASRDLSTLAVFDSWQGEAAQAAQHAVAQTRQDLDAHGNAVLAVALAAGKAADGIDRVQADLRSLENDAESAGFDIDPVTGAITPLPGSRHGREAAGVLQTLSSRLKAVIAEANSVDAELATAIDMADGDVPTVPKPPDDVPVMRAAPGAPVPVIRAVPPGAPPTDPISGDDTTAGAVPNLKPTISDAPSIAGDLIANGSGKWLELVDDPRSGDLAPGGANPAVPSYLEKAAKFGKRLGLVGNVLQVGSALGEATQEVQSGKENVFGAAWNVAPKTAGSLGGGLAGASYGAQLGASLGVAGGPVGMIIGAGVGGALGGFMGSKLGEAAGQGLTDAGKAVGGWVKSLF